MIANEADITMDNLKFLPTCNVSLIMGFPLICAGGAATGFWGWRLLASPRARRCRGDGSFAYGSGCDPLPGTAIRGLAAADGSQFLTHARTTGATHLARSQMCADAKR